jgi:hypothetical protein
MCVLAAVRAMRNESTEVHDLIFAGQPRVCSFEVITEDGQVATANLLRWCLLPHFHQVFSLQILFSKLREGRFPSKKELKVVINLILARRSSSTGAACPHPRRPGGWLYLSPGLVLSFNLQTHTRVTSAHATVAFHQCG